MNGLLAKFENIPNELLDYINKLEARILKLENSLKERDKTIITMQDKYGRLEFNYNKLVTEKYASKSEFFVDADKQSAPINDADICNNANNENAANKLTPNLKAEINFKEPKTGKSIRKKLPPHLPRVFEVLDFEESEKSCDCGGRLYKIDEFITEKLQYYRLD